MLPIIRVVIESGIDALTAVIYFPDTGPKNTKQLRAINVKEKCSAMSKMLWKSICVLSSYIC